MNQAINKLLQVATIHEYQMVTPELARVTVTHTPGMSKASIHAKINNALKGVGKAVSASFRPLTEATSTGFVAIAREIRQIENANAVTAGYRVIAKNLYMDNKDKSLWDVKTGAAGTYLARNGSDNLEALIQTARVSPSGSTPRLSRVTTASTQKRELCAFVKPASASNVGAQIDYGFCVAASAKGYTLVTEGGTVEVAPDTIVASYEIDMPPSKRKITAAADKQTMIEYYNQAYSYAPEYLAAIIRQIEEQASF